MSLLTTALLSSALTAAQPTVAPQITPQQVTDTCLELFTFVDRSDAYEVQEEPEILAIVNRGDDRACRARLTELQREGSSVRTQPAMDDDEMELEEDGQAVEVDRRTRQVREEVTLRETVAVQGVVDVLTGAPSVEIDHEPSTVMVEESAPQVTVSGGQPEILVREQAPIITMQMPTITIEQPAPIIEVVMPDPNVSVENAEPKITVRQGQPRVRVAVPEPRIDLDLNAAPVGEDGGEIQTRIRKARSNPEARDGMTLVARDGQDAEANVYVRHPEAEVQRTGAGAQPQIRVERSEPTIRFTGAEPEVKIEGEPKIEFKRVGEPRVEFRQNTESSEAKVADLSGKTVYGQDGEKIGEIGRVVQLGSSVYAVLEHGGVLGMGEKEVPLPLSSLSMEGDRLVADNLTEARLEELSDQEIDENYNLDDDQVLRLRMQERQERRTDRERN
ncbi:PRC-barrel domain-containing protein [Parvularcula maris]|uniref:PRC-barrel domain-containing protein n=1 Tax=Parvularcula maris TaxID=2965077 RepID=A0A9X2RIM8_9PROT|nr:PRC-barrel domain-containing protein [Parvularcula maris]MCQ8184022.1 PRC-barrel domain-containing protein [Parvularcula maris]